MRKQWFPVFFSRSFSVSLSRSIIPLSLKLFGKRWRRDVEKNGKEREARQRKVCRDKNKRKTFLSSPTYLPTMLRKQGVPTTMPTRTRGSLSYPSFGRIFSHLSSLPYNDRRAGFLMRPVGIIFLPTSFSMASSQTRNPAGGIRRIKQEHQTSTAENLEIEDGNKSTDVSAEISM